MAIDKRARDYNVCPCRNVTRGQIEDFIKETHISDLKTLCQAANVGNKCGGCREMLEQILTQVLADN